MSPHLERRRISWLRVGDDVHVRLPSMHPRGFQDVPGTVSEVLPGERYNVVRGDGESVAYGQLICGPGIGYGVVVTGSDEWLGLNVI